MDGANSQFLLPRGPSKTTISAQDKVAHLQQAVGDGSSVVRVSFCVCLFRVSVGYESRYSLMLSSFDIFVCIAIFYSCFYSTSFFHLQQQQQQ